MDAPPQISWYMRQAFAYTRRAIDEAVRPHGVTAAQWGVLNRLAERPGLSAAELARDMLTTPQAAQLTLASLEQRGLVDRKPDPNHRRIIRWALTQEGHRVADLCRADTLEAERELVAVFGAEERQTLVDLLLRFIRYSPPARG
jgi:DNA-binding MarR family transcriptional regulator